MNENSTYKIFIISGGTGRTAKQVVKAALTQFNKKNTNIVQFTDIRELAQVISIIQDAKKYNAMIVHTLVDDNIRSYVNNECDNMNIKVIDLMGDMIYKMSNMFNEESLQTPGLFSKLNQEYFQRIDAVQYAFKHDDGARVENIENADIVLLGVSRTFKTPLSIYLAYKGYFVMNIPIVDGIQPPSELRNVNPAKVFCLDTNPKKLSELRHSRNIKLGGNVLNYSDYESCKKEILYARRFYDLHSNWRKINVTDKSIEEIATEIIDKI